ncbi:MAG: cell division protein FtsZ [Bacteroidales bacterium]|nr:cell division protein FtsZ [Bacteroidales bacterium]
MKKQYDSIIPDDWIEKGNIIKIIGVGGGGTNAVTYMYEQKLDHIDYVVCNTDFQHLSASPVPQKLQLGGVITKGLGAGTDFLVGKKAATESMDDINNILNGPNQMVYVTCGMGGGTGTGAAPVIAETAKSKGLLTVAVVTIPFRDEGPDAMYRATEGIRELSRHVDSLIIIDNQKLYDVYPDLKFFDALDRANEVLATAVKSITDIIFTRGLINVDFADVKRIMKESGMAFMGIGSGEGTERARIAVESALTSPLMSNCDISKASKALVNITASELRVEEKQQIMDYVINATGGASNFKCGVVRDDSLGGKISVTIVATGYDMTDLPQVDLDSVNRDKIIVLDINDEDLSFIRHGLPISSGDLVSVTKRDRYNGKPALIVDNSEDLQQKESETAFDRRDRMLRKQRKEQLMQNLEKQSEQ